MKSTGITRKIDELGRIVIPKEIRKHLNIKDGEELEIFTEEDTIILKKYYRILGMKEKANNLIEIFYKYLNGNIVLTDREKVIFSFQKNIESNKLSNKYLSLLEERKKISSLENQSLEITKEYAENKKYIFYPIITNTDLLGSLLFIKDIISENDALIFNILYVLIKYELEN